MAFWLPWGVHHIMNIKHGVLLCVLPFMMAGCDLPRGAALQSEVLAEKKGPDGQKISEFGVVQVTRDSLPKVQNWPAVHLGAMRWLGRSDQPSSMVIAAGDSVLVTVWDAGENSLITAPGAKSVAMQTMKVAGSGDVFLPFVGKLKVAGLTPDAARNRIEEAYVATIPSAQVQLSVEPGRANTANLVAGVDKPGVFPLDGRNVTVLELLALGGGVNPNLTNPQVRLFRGKSVYGIALSRLYDDPALDSTLRGGDRVIVEAEDRAFLSLGSAGTQSRHIFPNETVTALDALAIVGGVNASRANPKGVLILREYPSNLVRADGVKGPEEERMVFVIDLTTADGMFSAGKFRIMPNDLIYVTESPVGKARTVMGLIGTAFGLAARADDF